MALTRKQETRIVFQQRDTIKAHVGAIDLKWLDSFLRDLAAEAESRGWSMPKIEAKPLLDAEVRDWYHTAILLGFDADFLTADGRLKELYPWIEERLGTLSNRRQANIADQLFFDVSSRDE